MACETKEFTIKTASGERRASVTQLPAMRAMKLLTRLGRVVGPSLAPLMSGDAGQVGPAVRDLFAQLTEQEVEHLISEVLFEGGARIEVGGELVPLKGIFATEFAGDLGAVLALVWEGLKANFGNFFDALGALVPPNLMARASPSKVSST